MKLEKKIRNCLFIFVLLVMLGSGFIPELRTNKLPGLIITGVAVFVLDYSKVGGKLNSYLVKKITDKSTK